MLARVSLAASRFRSSESSSAMRLRGSMARRSPIMPSAAAALRRAMGSVSDSTRISGSTAQESGTTMRNPAARARSRA